ncbi:MAG: TPM domain-containing protein [Clostridia bacterium]|nr:TPM domain-containing protein [Clostridia bacterium]
MKKIFIMLFIIVLSFNTFAFATNYAGNPYYESTPHVDASIKVYDFAKLLTDSEEKALYDDITRFIDTYDMDMAVVTIDNNNKGTAMDYADDFYDYNDFGIGDTCDGVLFLIDMDTREMWISTTGKAILVYDDARIDKILDYCYSAISRQDYYSCASYFVKYAGDYAAKGIPDSNRNAYIDENGEYIVTHESIPMPNSERMGISAIIAGVFAGIFGLVSASKHKLIKKATEAKYYLKNMVITNRTDKFVTTHTSRTYTGSSSSSGGSYHGGSSTHHSSSGSSHGGGGRHF